MNCADFEQLIALQAGGDLSPRESAQLAGHLERCAPCRQLSAEMAADLDWLRSTHQAPADRAALHQVRTSVMRQLEAEQGRWKGPWGRWLPLPLVWQVVAASAALAMLIGGVAWWRAKSAPGPVETQMAQTSQGTAGSPAPAGKDPLEKELSRHAAAPDDRPQKREPELLKQREQMIASVPDRSTSNLPSPARAARKHEPASPVSRKPAAAPEAMKLVRVSLEPKPDEPASETVMVKIPTSNPDIIVYWLMDEANKGD